MGVHRRAGAVFGNRRVVNLFLWRHAEAEDGHPDLSRALTERGRAQAARVGPWIRRAADGSADIVSSPARRARQTADAIGLPYRMEDKIAPGAEAADIALVLGLIAPTTAERCCVVVGHQPWIGELVSLLVTGESASWSVRKAQVWWLSWRSRSGSAQWTVRAVVDPDTF
jgi:phosphohistidine phosphatase